MHTHQTFSNWLGLDTAMKALIRRERGMRSLTSPTKPGFPTPEGKADQEEFSGLGLHRTRFQLSNSQTDQKPWLTFQEASETGEPPPPEQKRAPQLTFRHLVAFLLGGCMLTTLWIFVHPWAAVCAFLFLLLLLDLD